MNMTRINYVVRIHDWESVVFNRNCFLKKKDFSRLAALRTP